MNIGIPLLVILGLICAILNIILFFKVWGMTNHIKGLHRLTFLKEVIQTESEEILNKALDETIYREAMRNAHDDNTRLALWKDLEALSEDKKKK